jgi:hypothetical protein
MNGLAKFQSRTGGKIADQPEGKPTPKAKAKRPEFTVMELEWAADMAKASGTPGAMVWVLLQYMAWKVGSQTFPFSNVLLTKYGISRKVKYCTLARLEQAGRIRIDRCGVKKAPIVTLLAKP